MRGEKENRNSIMQSLSEKEESGSAKILAGVAEYTFNEMAMNGLMEGKFETEDFKREMQAQLNTIWQFQHAEEGVKESKKIIEVLGEYEEINKAGGETLNLSLDEFCKELDKDGKPRLEINKSELMKNMVRYKKSLKKKEK